MHMIMSVKTVTNNTLYHTSCIYITIGRVTLTAFSLGLHLFLPPPGIHSKLSNDFWLF